MKKAILILSILALNAFAANCLDYIHYLFNGEISDIFHLDSAYAVSFVDDTDTSYSTVKYFYTDNKLDSTITCGSYGDSKEYVIFPDKDSSITYTYGLDSGKPDSLEIISYNPLRNDTLYNDRWFAEGRPYNFGNKKFAPDPNDENICNMTIYNSEYESENGTYQLIITNTENGFKVFNTLYNQSAFFIYTNNSTTSIQCKVRPAVNYKNTKHFDLLGRPIKNNFGFCHTPQVAK